MSGKPGRAARPGQERRICGDDGNDSVTETGESEGEAERMTEEARLEEMRKEIGKWKNRALDAAQMACYQEVEAA